MVHRRRRAPEHTHTEKDRNCELLWQLAKSASPKSAEVIRSPDRDFRGIQVPRDTLTRTDVSEVREEEEEEGERRRSERCAGRDTPGGRVTVITISLPVGSKHQT